MWVPLRHMQDRRKLLAPTGIFPCSSLRVLFWSTRSIFQTPNPIDHVVPPLLEAGDWASALLPILYQPRRLFWEPLFTILRISVVGFECSVKKYLNAFDNKYVIDFRLAGMPTKMGMLMLDSAFIYDTFQPLLGTVTLTVTTVGGKYYINGAQQTAMNHNWGVKCIFNLDDAINNNHPFILSTTADGAHGGGTEITNVPKSTNYDTFFSSTQTRSLAYMPTAAGSIYYHCGSHSNMGVELVVTASTTSTHNGAVKVKPGCPDKPTVAISTRSILESSPEALGCTRKDAMVPRSILWKCQKKCEAKALSHSGVNKYPTAYVECVNKCMKEKTKEVLANSEARVNPCLVNTCGRSNGTIRIDPNSGPWRLTSRLIPKQTQR